MSTIRFHVVVFLLSGLTISGCSDTSKTDAGSIGQSIGKNVTEFAQGVGTGVDTQLQVEIELSPTLIDAGVTHTIAKQQASINDPKKSISIYFISTRALSSTLIAKAYNEDKQEIGRASADAKLRDDDAQYISFTFPPEMDRQTVKLYKIDIKPLSEPAQ